MKLLGHRVSFVLLERGPWDAAEMQRHWGDSLFQVRASDQRGTPATRAAWAVDKRLRRLALEIFAPLRKKLLRREEQHQQRIDDRFDDRWAVGVQQVVRNTNPDVVVAQYVFNSKVLEALPTRVLKVIDTVDVFSERRHRQARHGVISEQISLDTDEEIKGIDRADCVVAIQRWEAEHFRRISTKKVFTVGHLIEPRRLPEPVNEKPTIAYVGSDNEDNRLSLARWMAEIWPRVRTSVPNARIMVAGRVAKVLTAHSMTSGVVSLGPVQDMADVYGRADVVVNPCVSGTGLKIKSVEALAFGKPLVTTREGAAGIEAYAGVGFEMVESFSDLTLRTVSLLNDSGRRRRLSRGARECFVAYRSEALEQLNCLLRQEAEAERPGCQV